MKHWQQAEMAQCYQNIGISVMITIIIMIFCHDQLKLALWSQFLLKSRCEMFVVIKYGETRLIVREKRTEGQKKGGILVQKVTTEQDLTQFKKCIRVSSIF